MKIQLLPSMFHQANNTALNGRLEQKNSLKDALNKIVSGLSEKDQKQTVSNNERQTQIQRAVLDTYDKTADSSAIQDLDDGMLVDLASVLKLGNHYVNSDIEKVNEFKQNLTRFDTNISKYEDMLNGREALSKGTTMESVEEMLAEERENRGAYIVSSGNRLRDDTWGNSIKDVAICGNIVSQDLNAQMNDLDLQFHPEAPDIYKELDRITGELGNAAKGIGGALKILYEEMDRRGMHDAGYQMYNRHIDMTLSNFYKEGIGL